MDLIAAIIQNKEVFKVLYAIVIVLVCSIIVLRTHKLFHLSLHQGIRYFRNAFFFYGIGFFIRYILGSSWIYTNLNQYYLLIIELLFEFFLVMAGFFLLYSLLWKKFESAGSKPLTSLFHSRIAIFYIYLYVINIG